MRLTVQRTKLLEGLGIIGRAIPSKSSMPSLTHCLLEANDNTLILTGSDLEHGLRVSVKSEVERGGATLVPYKLLVAILRTLKEQDVSLSQEDYALDIECGSSITKLNVYSAQDYHAWPKVEGKTFEVDSSLLAKLVDVGTSCAIKNPARPLWGATFIEAVGNELSVVSTDQFCLSKASHRVDCEDISFIIPADVAKNLVKDMSGPVSVTISENQVSLEGSLSAYARLIDGKYYNYRAVIPEVFETEVIVSKEDFQKAVSRASVLASEETHAVVLKVEDLLTIEAGSPDKGHMSERLNSEVLGGPVEVWLQHKYINQALAKCDGDTIKIGIVGDKAPLTISPHPRDSLSTTFVIMPMAKSKGDD